MQTLTAQARTMTKWQTSISANADGPRDAASRKIDHCQAPSYYLGTRGIIEGNLPGPIFVCWRLPVDRQVVQVQLPGPASSVYVWIYL